MPDALSQNLAYLRPSETVAISNETKRRRAAGEDVIDLSVGEPDFDTPSVPAQAGIQAIQRGMTRYPPNIGIPELRTAIARNLSLNYYMNYSRLPQVVNQAQFEQSLLFRASWALL